MFVGVQNEIVGIQVKVDDDGKMLFFILMDFEVLKCDYWVFGCYFQYQVFWGVYGIIDKVLVADCCVYFGGKVVVGIGGEDGGCQMLWRYIGVIVVYYYG